MPKKGSKFSPRKGHKKSFLKQQKQLLETKLRECLKHQKQALSGLAVIERGGTDMADIATAILEQWVGFKLVNCCAKDIRGICQAIQTIESGTYGICENCGGLIPEKRLAPEANPWATKCTKCQKAEEQQ